MAGRPPLGFRALGALKGFLSRSNEMSNFCTSSIARRATSPPEPDSRDNDNTTSHPWCSSSIGFTTSSPRSGCGRRMQKFYSWYVGTTDDATRDASNVYVGVGLHGLI